MAQDTDVTIVGSGPYGVGLAAHLRARGVKYRIFGESMRFWRDMPIGVNLKSLAFASDLALPERGFTYPQWCLDHGLEDYEPCTMQSFAAYGVEMQQRFVPDLEEVQVTKVEMRDKGFEVTLASGQRFGSRRVVVCTGLSGMAYVPEVLQGLGPNRVRHTFHLSDYSGFRNKKVAVIGAGASAIEAGALVHEAGGTGEVFARCAELVFHGREPRQRPLWKRIKAPTTWLGTSRSGWVLQHIPLAVYRMPRERRTRFVKTHLGPASPWWIQDRLEHVPIHLQQELLGAGASGDRALLKFQDGEGRVKEFEFDFVISGTGYKVDVGRLAFLDPEIVRRIRRIETAPELSIQFESSVPGLHFVGPLSFMCFGPLFRFVSGAQIASPRLARYFS
jgi:cation diffusion facilitator CzcD-associated flavoprotein CzcO